MINRCCDCGRLFRGPASIGAICEACDLAREIEADETERINAARISNMRAMRDLASKCNAPAARGEEVGNE